MESLNKKLPSSTHHQRSVPVSLTDLSILKRTEKWLHIFLYFIFCLIISRGSLWNKYYVNNDKVNRLLNISMQSIYCERCFSYTHYRRIMEHTFCDQIMMIERNEKFRLICYGLIVDFVFFLYLETRNWKLIGQLRSYDHLRIGLTTATGTNSAQKKKTWVVVWENRGTNFTWKAAFERCRK